MAKNLKPPANQLKKEQHPVAIFAAEADEQNINEFSGLLSKADQNQDEEGMDFTTKLQIPIQENIIDDQVDPELSRYEKAPTFSVITGICIIQNICAMRKKRKNDTDPLKHEDLPLFGKTEEVSAKINDIEREYNKHLMKHKSQSLVGPY